MTFSNCTKNYFCSPSKLCCAREIVLVAYIWNRHKTTSGFVQSIVPNLNEAFLIIVEDGLS